MNITSTVAISPRFARPLPLLSLLLNRAADCGLILPLGAASLVSVVALVSSGRLSLPLAAVAFLTVYSSYLIDHLADIGRLDACLTSERTRKLARAKAVKFFGIGAFASALALSWLHAGLATTSILLCFPLSVAFYGTSLFGRLTGGRCRYRRLKDIPGLKSFYTAAFWCVLMMYAAVFVRTEQTLAIAFFCAYMMLSALVNTVFSDYKDVERDRAEGVRTWIVILGLERTTTCLRLINFFALVLLLAAILIACIPSWMIALTFVHVYVDEVVVRGDALTRAGGNPGDALIDAEYALWLPFALLGMQAGL